MADDGFVLTLVRQALEEIENNPGRLSSPARKALRIARLRSDWEAVYWLRSDLEPWGKLSRNERLAEVSPYFSADQLGRIYKASLDHTLSLREIAFVGEDGEVDRSGVTTLTIPELEEALAAMKAAKHEPLPANLHPYDAAAFSEQRRSSDAQAALTMGQLRNVLSRIGQRVHTHLSGVERQLALGQQRADVFEHNRRYVDQRLAGFCPTAGEQLQSAYLRASDADAEARSHALTSVRRALKSLADWLYPPSVSPVVGNDGITRTLDDSKFINRLWQYLAESTATPGAKKNLQADLQQTGELAERLNLMASKGIHADVEQYEVNSCVLNLYTFAGALIRLHEQRSAALLDPDAFE